MNTQSSNETKTAEHYHHENVEYHFAGKWQFRSAGFALITKLRGGRKSADKVARVVAGALKRTKGAGLDNLARANIEKIQVPA